MNYKILLAGIDGSGKSTSSDLLMSRLSQKYRVLKIGGGDSSLTFKSTKKSILSYKWYNAIKRVRAVSTKYRLYGFFLIFNIMYKYILSRYLGNFKGVDITIHETDTLLHPAVYVTYHFPSTKMISPSLRFAIVRTLFGLKKNFIVFYLDTDPNIAMERIIERKIKIQSHENWNDLEELRKEFDKVLKVASQNGFEIVRINTNNKDLGEVVSEMETVLKEKFSLASEGAI